MQFPTLDAWNVSVQRALTPSLTMTAAYIGNKGTHTLSDGDGNSTNPNEAAINLPASFSPTGQALHFDPSVAGGKIAANGGTANTNYLQRYYGGTLTACQDPNYTPTVDPNITLPVGACGWSQGIQYDGDNQNTSFEAIQITLAQAAWHGLSLNANYQWAIAKDSASSFYTWSKSAVYGNSSDVRRQASTVYGSYALPIGKGKQFLGNINHAENLILGGFEISGTGNISSGLPFSLSLNSCANDIPGDAPCQPNATGKLPTSLSKFVPGTGWTFYQAQTLGAVFSDPGLDNIGNVQRNTYYGPHFWNTDLSLQKAFNVWEKVDTKFRMDLTNALNHINPGTPGGNIQSPGTITGEAPGPGPRQIEFSLSVKF
jgi:hypothetical protein